MLADQVITAIGSRYNDPHALDDTGLKLSLADTHRMNGHIDTSARIRVSMAASRMSALRFKLKCRP